MKIIDTFNLGLVSPKELIDILDKWSKKRYWTLVCAMYKSALYAFEEVNSRCTKFVMPNSHAKCHDNWLVSYLRLIFLWQMKSTLDSPLTKFQYICKRFSFLEMSQFCFSKKAIGTPFNFFGTCIMELKLKPGFKPINFILSITQPEEDIRQWNLS